MIIVSLDHDSTHCLPQLKTAPDRGRGSVPSSTACLSGWRLVPGHTLRRGAGRRLPRPTEPSAACLGTAARADSDRVFSSLFSLSLRIHCASCDRRYSSSSIHHGCAHRSQTALALLQSTPSVAGVSCAGPRTASSVDEAPERVPTTDRRGAPGTAGESPRIYQ